jgi:uncharacterized membrane protein YkgB
MLAANETGSWDRRLEPIGRGVLRYGLVALLLIYGALKFFEFEAIAIQPLIENHPLMSWLVDVFGLRGASALIGVTELVAAVLIVLRGFAPRLSAYGSLLAAGMFVMTLSFLITTPQPPTGFLLKDLMLLGAALYTAGEAFSATRRQPAS